MSRIVPNEAGVNHGLCLATHAFLIDDETAFTEHE